MSGSLNRAVWFGTLLGFLVVTVVCFLLADGCAYGVALPRSSARVRYDVTDYAPTPEQTQHALDVVAARAPELFPDLEPYQAAQILGRVTISYTDDALPSGDPEMITTGYEFRYMVVILANERFPDTSTNALVHELVHVLLYARFGDPETNHTGRWTPETNDWILSVKRDL